MFACKLLLFSLSVLAMGQQDFEDLFLKAERLTGTTSSPLLTTSPPPPQTNNTDENNNNTGGNATLAGKVVEIS
jgi:hypothetical protein